MQILGVLDDVEWEAGQVHLASGASLVLYTDGVTDVVNAAGDRLRLSRLEDAAAALVGAPAAEIRDSLLDAVHAWAAGEPFRRHRPPRPRLRSKRDIIATRDTPMRYNHCTQYQAVLDYHQQVPAVGEILRPRGFKSEVVNCRSWVSQVLFAQPTNWRQVPLPGMPPSIDF
ncbi:MAG: SpoIIE family protein phosphatase [Anaerolineae bacterium]|nr:SpoIIE family protein phosphatase [Anaerolineae bacterium]